MAATFARRIYTQYFHAIKEKDKNVIVKCSLCATQRELSHNFPDFDPLSAFVFSMLIVTHCIAPLAYNSTCYVELSAILWADAVSMLHHITPPTGYMMS